MNFTETTRIFVGPLAATNVELLSNTQILCDTPPGAVGAVTVKAQDIDGEGVLEDSFTYFEPLRVNSVSPNRSPVRGGELVELRGAGFTEETLVTVGGRSAISVEFIDSETLQLLTPPSTVGRQDIRATDVTSSAVLAGAITYYDRVSLDEVFPSAGTTEGGTSVTLRGAGFVTDSMVQFGDIEVPSTYVSDTELTVTTPPGPTGFVNVTVTNSNGIAGLVDGYYYIRPNAGTDLQVYGIVPDRGSTAGGTVVTIAGERLSEADLTVTLGGAEMTVDEVTPNSLRATTPPGTEGLADLVVRNAAGEVVLSEAFAYIEALEVTAADPAEGPVEGGTEVALTGVGLSPQTVVLFGSQRAVVLSREVDGTGMVVETPAGSLGLADIQVTDRGLSSTLSDGFTYTQEVELFGMNPTKGSIAGGTFVVIRGVGFTSVPAVEFDGNAGTDVQLLDASTVTVRTPPGREGTAEVTLQFEEGGRRYEVPGRFTYFNPGSAFGGTWGDAINGSVNVSVYSAGGGPIENAFVMLSVDANTPYQGWTDANGQVTFSGASLSGDQTVTAAAPTYSSATVQSFNAENISVLLYPTPPPGNPPAGPPLAIVSGVITGVEKVAEPGPNEYELAIVQTTQVDMFTPNPPPGSGNTVLSNGPFRLQARPGDVAIVAVAGLFNNLTNEFTPYFMG
ncbi:MAG: IPT/TIG domain-containing protein, partial [Myxococcota bacterium]